jgi:hypothetical protein
MDPRKKNERKPGHGGKATDLCRRKSRQFDRAVPSSKRMPPGTGQRDQHLAAPTVRGATRESSGSSGGQKEEAWRPFQARGMAGKSVHARLTDTLRR